ncbi:PD-(D/E)XK nuclease family protein [Longimicrobium sp.]|uniref:PD-(D/E)XK nuclease family protein n=1 Tax=Longimicrobium sp. TaxID=2029185 RepID=UPI002EDB3D5C
MSAPAIHIPDNTIASFSDLGKFAQCRRAWYLGTYRKLRLKDEPPTGPLPFGSRIHAALEAYYDLGLHPAEAWKQLMAHEYAVAEANGNPFIEALDKESKLGHRMMEGYLEWLEADGEDAYFDTVAVEQALTHELPMVVDTPDGDTEVTILLRGKLDRQIRRKSDGTIYVADFKTMGNFGEPAMVTLYKSPQPRLYRRLLKANDPDSDVRGVVYTLLRKVLRTPTAKPPFYKRVTIEISEVEQAAYDVRLEGAVSELARTRFALDAGVDHRRIAYFQPGWQCATCPFKLPCDLMQSSPQGAEDMLADLYTEGNPWARYLADSAGDAEISGGPA